MGAPQIRTPDQRLRVFVSSTLQELAPERHAVLDTVRRMRLTPVMFELGARPYPPRELYRAYLAQSDVFLGLYWQSSGWTAPGEDVSGLEDEYRLSAGIPRLLFVKEPAPERDPRLADLLADAARSGAPLRLFADADELAEVVADGLAELLGAHFARSVRPRAPGVADAPAGAGGAAAPSVPALPAPRYPLVDRVAERARAAELLGAGTRLLTLVGPGGAGKSRLALQVASDQLADRPHGAVLVDLAAVQHVEEVVPAVALAVGVREHGDDLVATVAEALRGRRMLLVLDNVEHVRDAAPDVARLLSECPDVAVVATSRMPLRVRAEVELPVGPLAVPPAGPTARHPGRARRRSVRAADLEPYDAVALFVQRAQAIDPAFRLDDTNAADVATLCVRLDGLPLALELAASATRLLAPAQLVRRLDSSSGGFGRAPQDLPERQRTLRATLAWSEELLPPDVAAVLHRLSTFLGGWTLDAADAVAAAETDGRSAPVLDALETLVDASLVQPVDFAHEVRFTMLATVREYARDRLAETGEEHEVRRRHAAWFADLAEQAEPYLTGPHQTQWLDRLTSEHANLHAALDWATDHDPATAVRLAMSLWQYWEARGHYVEGRLLLERLLGRGPDALPDATPEHARLLNAAGSLADWLGDYAAAERCFTDALRIAREVGDSRREAAALHNLGIVRSYRGDLPGAVEAVEASLRIKRGLGDERFTANSLDNLGRLLTYRGDLPGATAALNEALDAFRRVDDAYGVAVTAGNLAAAELPGGDLDRVAALHRESLAAFVEVGDDDGLAESLERIGALALATDRTADAARLFGAARELRAGVGSKLPPPERALHERDVEQAVEALGSEAYEALVADGATGGREAALALARSVVG